MKLARREPAGLDVKGAREALAWAKTVAEVKDIGDKASAVAKYLRKQRGCWKQALDAEELALEAHIRSAEILEDLKARGRRAGRGRPRKTLRLETFSDLLGVSDKGAARLLAHRQSKALDIRETEPERIAAYVKRQRETLGAITLSGLVDAKSIAFSSASNEWYTPKDYVEAARRVLGAIDLDPASCAKANTTVGAGHYFTEKDDGLSRPWVGRIWLNPPYGKKEGESSAGVWAARLAEEYHAGNTKAAVLLVNASTEQRWFQPLLAEFPCCLTDHRIAFAVAGEEEPKSPISGNAFFYLGPDTTRFAEEFAPFGAVVRPFGS